MAITELTPAGTVNVWSLPVEENVHVTLEPDREQFDGNAVAELAGAAAHSANNPTVAASSTASLRDRRKRYAE